VALEIVWTRQAARGYARVIVYLEENWTWKEVNAFEKHVTDFLSRLSEYPELLKPSSKKNVRRGPIDRHTLLTYRVTKDRIELLNMRGTRQRPLK
jgi:plasmid stabilization system protein ParE